MNKASERQPPSQRDPSLDIEALAASAKAAFSEGNLERAVELTRRIAAVDRSNFKVQITLAKLLLELGRPQEAASAMLLARSLSPNISAQNQADGITEPPTGVAIRPDHARLGERALQAGDYFSAIQEFSREAQYDSERIAPWLGLLKSSLLLSRLAREKIDFYFDSIQFIDSLVTRDAASVHDNRRSLMKHCVDHADKRGLVVELGVHRGHSAKLLAEMMPGRTIHGFDSFEGLPEAFGNLQKGHFDLEGQLPNLGEAITLHKGWFSDTLPTFLRSTMEPVAFLHLDCDVYSSATTAFTLLGDRLVEGTVILMDDYHSHRNWRQDIHKAFEEFLARRARPARYIGFDVFRAGVVLS